MDEINVNGFKCSIWDILRQAKKDQDHEQEG
jgi:hypothetical protein